MAKKKSDTPEPTQPFANRSEATAAAESGEPVTIDRIDVAPLRDIDKTVDAIGRKIIGPVVVEGVRYEDVPHRRAYNLTINGRECHFVGEVGDAREYRPAGRR